MARGAEVITRAERIERVARYARAPGMKMRQISLAGDMEFTFRGTPIAYANVMTPNYPTHELLATLALVLQATQGLPDKPAEQAPDGREYNRRMQRANEERFK